MKTEKLFILLFVPGRSNREIDKNIEEKTDTILCLIEIIELNRKNSFDFDSCICDRLLIITAEIDRKRISVGNVTDRRRKITRDTDTADSCFLVGFLARDSICNDVVRRILMCINFLIM